MTRLDEMPDAGVKEPGPNRRTLLSGAVGGFVLTASGLFLRSDEDAAAREGAYGGQLGGRHGKDRRGLDKRQRKRRDRGGKKDRGRRDDAPPKSNGPFRATALTVFNRRGQTLDCNFFFRVKTGPDEYALPTADGQRFLAPNESFRYDPDRYRVGVLVKQVLGADDIYADVRNVSFWFPRGGVTKGSNLDPRTGTFGSALIEEQMFVQTEAHDTSGITLWRRLDSENRIEWELYID